MLEMTSINTTEEQVISTQEKILLYQKMQKLDKETREVIYLRITGELSFKEISTILDKTENWARVTFYRGKNKLKEVDWNEWKKECKIIQDLLPNYIENLTSIQTNEYIEEHIASCKECKENLENMQNEIVTDTKGKNKKK